MTRRHVKTAALWLLALVFLALLFSALFSCSKEAPAPTKPVRSGPRFAFDWQGAALIDSAYIHEALADVQDSVNAWFAPPANDIITVQVSVDDLNHPSLIERGKAAATNNYRRDLLNGVIAEGGEGLLDFSSGIPVIEGAEIIIDRKQLAAETDRTTWKWVLLHETIHVFGFGTSQQWNGLKVATGDSLKLSSGTWALDGTGHWEQTHAGRLLEPYFPGVDRAFVSEETKEALAAIGWPRR